MLIASANVSNIPTRSGLLKIIGLSGRSLVGIFHMNRLRVAVRSRQLEA
jgi:hypothetical protein